MSAVDGSFEFRDIPAGDYTLACHRWLRPDRMPAIRHHSRPHAAAGGPSAGTGVPRCWSRGGDRVGNATDASAPQKGSAGVSRARCVCRTRESTTMRRANWRRPSASRRSSPRRIRTSPCSTFELGRFEESIAESARAIQIGGPDPRNLCNLATAQARLHRFAEAEKSARAALRLDSGYLKANLILGSILVDQAGDTRARASNILKRPLPNLPRPGNSSSSSGHRAEPCGRNHGAHSLLPRQRDRPPRRTSAGDIGTCCCRSVMGPAC